MLENIFNQVNLRLDGAEKKKKNILVQYISSAVLITCALTLLSRGHYYFSGIFLCEGLGQFFLATDNKRHPGSDYRYYHSTREGQLAFLFFNLINIFRALAAYEISGNSFASCLMMVFYVGFYFWGIQRKIPTFHMAAYLIVPSSLFLGVTAIYSGLIPLGVGELSYSLLLLVGIFVFQVWMVELFNILIWLGMFWFLIQV